MPHCTDALTHWGCQGRRRSRRSMSCRGCLHPKTLRGPPWPTHPEIGHAEQHESTCHSPDAISACGRGCPALGCASGPAGAHLARASGWVHHGVQGAPVNELSPLVGVVDGDCREGQHGHDGGRCDHGRRPASARHRCSRSKTQRLPFSPLTRGATAPAPGRSTTSSPARLPRHASTRAGCPSALPSKSTHAAGARTQGPRQAWQAQSATARAVHGPRADHTPTPQRRFTAAAPSPTPMPHRRPQTGPRRSAWSPPRRATQKFLFEMRGPFWRKNRAILTRRSASGYGACVP
jgi:hypothetical protein